MRIAILSDIHSNLHALEAVLEDATKRSPDKYYCLGDIIGYNASPKECLDIIRDICELVVFGNHEYAVTYPQHSGSFNPEAEKAIDYTIEKLEPGDITWLESLEPRLILDEITLAHGSFRSFDEYVTDATIARLSLEISPTRLLLVGHTHYPEGYEYDLETRSTKAMDLFGEGEAILEKDKRYLVNVGSIGQPRDGDSRASYAVYDTEESLIQIIRVKYDINEASRAIKEAGLPEFLAKRLFAGR
jgi:diadenosine tetraphosphatase ApaH/serine/threonine PP2A family protein phosphatase